MAVLGCNGLRCVINIILSLYISHTHTHTHFSHEVWRYSKRACAYQWQHEILSLLQLYITNFLVFHTHTHVHRQTRGLEILRGARAHEQEHGILPRQHLSKAHGRLQNQGSKEAPKTEANHNAGQEPWWGQESVPGLLLQTGSPYWCLVASVLSASWLEWRRIQTPSGKENARVPLMWIWWQRWTEQRRRWEWVCPGMLAQSCGALAKVPFWRAKLVTPDPAPCRVTCCVPF